MILNKNLAPEIYTELEKYLNQNSYLKTIWSYYDE
jgi:arginine decarboxylase